MRRRPIVLCGTALAVCFGLAAWARYANEVSMSVRDEHRVIVANGIPEHAYGPFPNRGNPNSVSPQNHTFRVPIHPRPAARPTPTGMNPFGIALNGVPFDPAAAEWWNRDPGSGWQYEALSGAVDLGMDGNNAHVQPNGAYHYHGVPEGLLGEIDRGGDMVLAGYAGDGYPIYARYGYEVPEEAGSRIVTLRSSYRLREGSRPGGPGGRYDGTFVEDWEYVAGTGDLDAQNGRSGVTPEYPQGTYYYVLTDEYPFIPRAWRGTPDASFQTRGHGGPPPGGGRGGRHGHPPPHPRPPHHR